MCHQPCIDFGNDNLPESEVKGKRVIEVGSRDVNGSLRQLIIPKGPAEYIGVDIESGPGVDRICNVFDLTKEFGAESFDVVISTEMLEHVQDWRGAVSQFKSILKPNGVLLITTRSKGFPYHGYPDDFWRFEVSDMRDIFSDMEIRSLESDIPEAPGVFVKVEKPQVFRERDLNDQMLYSIVTDKRCRNIERRDLLTLPARRLLRNFYNRASNSARYRFGRYFKASRS